MSNTITITPKSVAAIALPILQNILAPASRFCTVIPTPSRPGKVQEVPLISVVHDTLVDTATFEPQDCSINPITATPHRYTQIFGIGNVDNQSGAELGWLVQANVEKFANTLADAIMAIVTEANFGAPIVEIGAAAFGQAEVETMLAAFSGNRSLILDTPFWARVKPTMLPPGFTNVFEHGRWSTAGANIRGLVADPRAIVLCTGLPDAWDVRSKTGFVREVVKIPGLGLDVEVATWPIVGTRALNASFDVFLSPNVANANALRLLKSA